MTPRRVPAGLAATEMFFRFRRKVLRVLCALFVPAVLAGAASVARAQNCVPDGLGEISISSGSCTAVPGSTPNRITAQNTGQVTANGVTVSVPFGTGVTAQSGGQVTFGMDPTFNGSTVVSQFGGGGIIGLLATGISGTTGPTMARTDGSSMR